MTSGVTHNKVYIEIVKKLKEMVKRDGLKPGDRIPSERELSERLNVGRSSVREALRSLELLGLIETRRGEGTFFRHAHGNQLVQLLGAFILQDERAREDIIETKHRIEMDFLRLIVRRNNEDKLLRLKTRVLNRTVSDDEFFKEIAELAGNYLIYRIWMVLNDYWFSLEIPSLQNDKKDYLALIDALISKDWNLISGLYKKLRSKEINTKFEF